MSLSEIERGLRARRILVWDQIAEEGQEFGSIEDHPRFTGRFEAAQAFSANHCANHGHLPSAFVCSQCGRGYCDPCAPSAGEGLRARTCPACGRVMREGDPRWHEQPFWNRLGEVLAFPVRKMSWATTLGIGGLMWLGTLPLIFPFNIFSKVFLLMGFAYVVHALAMSGQGEKELTMPDIADVGYLVGRGFLVVIVIIAVSLPIILLDIFVLVALLKGSVAGVVLLFLIRVPLGLVLFVYYPMALGVVVVWHNWQLAFRPDIVVIHMLKIKRDYLAMLAAFVVLGIAEIVVTAVGSLVPILGWMVTCALGAYVALVEAHILGWTLYMKEHELGWA